MYELVTLRAKSYAYDIEHSTTIRAKGIRGNVIRNHLTFDDHKRCLFAADNDDDDDDVESDERDDEFDALMGKLIALSCERQVIACLHAAAAALTMPSISYPLPPPPPPQPLTQRSYELYTPYRENVSIRSFKHQMKTIKTMKLTLNRSDDKRHVLPDRVHTLLHGHYKIV